MAKRRLTEQQKRHIQEHRKLKQLNKYDNSKNDLGDPQKGLVISHHGTSLLIEKVNGELIKCHYRQTLGALVTGDIVTWQQQLNANYGIVTDFSQRSSLLARPTRLSNNKKNMAANIDQIIIVIAVEPAPVEHYIDRYLVAAELQDIKPIILLNKIDLLTQTNKPFFCSLLQIYADLGYTTIKLSAKNEISIKILTEHLGNKTSIFTGQSGVGKSALINTLVGTEIAKTNMISDSNKRGKHTTTAAKLYHIHFPNHIIGNLIDSPGIREFGLWDLSVDDVFNGFNEFQPFLGLCEFRNCQHLPDTPNCAIAKAVTSGKINEQRFKNYHRIVQELK